MNVKRLQAIDYYLGGPLILALKPLAILAGALLGRDHGLTPRGEITVVKLLGGGSLVLALPALLALRRRYPELPLVLVCTPGTRAFAELLGVFDGYRVIDTGSPARLLATGLAAWLGTLRTADTVIDLEAHSRLSTVFSLVTCARNRVGFYLDVAFWRRRIATHLFFFNRQAPRHRLYEQIAAALDAPVPPLAEVRRWFRSVQELPEAPPTDGDRPPLRIGLGCFCSGLSAERMLAPEAFAGLLAAAFGDREVSFELFGAEADRPQVPAMARALAEACPRATVVDHVGRLSLRESVVRIAGLDRFWSIDTGLLHIARLLGVRCTSFFGPTDPAALLLPFDDVDEAVNQVRLACRPCVHVAEDPPCGGNNLCMRALTDPAAAGDGNPPWIIR